MLVDFHVSNGFPKELEMFVAGTVLQVNKKPIFYDIIEKVTAIPFRLSQNEYSRSCQQRKLFDLGGSPGLVVIAATYNQAVVRLDPGTGY